MRLSLSPWSSSRLSVSLRYLKILNELLHCFGLQEMNIKVFDFGAVYHHVNEDSEIPPLYPVGRDAPEVFNRGMFAQTVIFDVFML